MKDVEKKAEGIMVTRGGEMRRYRNQYDKREWHIKRCA